jgi:outer membrane immunogenic protein
MSRLLASAAAAALLSGAALAADLPVPPMQEVMEAAPLAYDWTGIHVGVNGGYGWGESGASNQFGVASGPFDIEGFFAGGQVGANWQNNWLVLGAETDLQWSDINGGVANANCGPTCATSIDWFGTARGVVGIAFDRLLIYGTGGLAYGQVSANVTGGAFSGSDIIAGWVGGGGVAFGATRNLFFEGEYLFMDLGSIDYPGAGVVVVTSTAAETHLVRGSVNWRFGLPTP